MAVGATVRKNMERLLASIESSEEAPAVAAAALVTSRLGLACWLLLAKRDL